MPSESEQESKRQKLLPHDKNAVDNATEASIAGSSEPKQVSQNSTTSDAFELRGEKKLGVSRNNSFQKENLGSENTKNVANPAPRPMVSSPGPSSTGPDSISHTEAQAKSGSVSDQSFSVLESKTSGSQAVKLEGSPRSSTPPHVAMAPSSIHSQNQPQSLSLHSKATLNHSASSSRQRLVIIKDHTDSLAEYLNRLRLESRNSVLEISPDQLFSVKDSEFECVHFCITYNENLPETLRKLSAYVISNPKSLLSCSEISLHFDFGKNTKWRDAPETCKSLYLQFLSDLEKAAASKVAQCSFINKYDASTMYITEKDQLSELGREIQADISRWTNLRVLDYGNNSIRLIPGVKFPDSLRVLNIGGGLSLETLAGFKMPSQLRSLDLSRNLLSSIDYVSFPSSLERLNLSYNKLYFLNYVDFPLGLKALDVSQNRIESLKNVTFPKTLVFLSIANNPIECIKGVRFPESIQYLDASCLPNESMSGIKFPDSTISLNLQQSMTNIRGLKLPPYLRYLNLAANGVNSINPLKLPDSITALFLANNNIKVLNKVVFPSAITELYLGNNSLTTLKNVQLPSTLQVLDIEMDPHNEENEKFITSLKDVIFPPNLRILKLGYHLIKSIDTIEFPYGLEELCLQYNDLRVFRNVKFGPKLTKLDLSGNQELLSLDNVVFPASLRELKLPSLLLNNLPAPVVERANAKELVLKKSLPYTI